MYLEYIRYKHVGDVECVVYLLQNYSQLSCWAHHFILLFRFVLIEL